MSLTGGFGTEHDVSRQNQESRWHRGAKGDEHTRVAELDEAESVDDVNDVLALGSSTAHSVPRGNARLLAPFGRGWLYE